MNRIPFILLPWLFSTLLHGQHSVMPAEHRALFESHCFKCHNADKQKGKVRLDDLPFTISDIETAERCRRFSTRSTPAKCRPKTRSNCQTKRRPIF